MSNRRLDGAKLYYQAKVGSFRDSIRVLRESIGVAAVTGLPQGTAGRTARSLASCTARYTRAAS